MLASARFLAVNHRDRLELEDVVKLTDLGLGSIVDE